MEDEINLKDSDFVGSFGAFSINPSVVQDIKYFNNALYFYFKDIEVPALALGFTNEKDARKSLEGFKMILIKKNLESEA